MIANFLEALRREGWKQVEIAEHCGLSTAFINGMTKGQSCSLETAIKIADAFGVTLDMLVGRTPPASHITREPKAKTRKAEGRETKVARHA
jgi:plasmid maintenance system antidote protein VapI